MNRVTLVAALLGLAACGGDDPPAGALPRPGPLRVGTATVRMPVPLGIGTAGYGGFGVDVEPSPFAEIYPATTRIHQHPDFRVVVISRGPGFELVLLRSDTVGVFQQFRRAVVLELKERLGRDLDQALVIGATHTHSGPGRVIDAGGPFDLIADRFFPEFFDRMVDGMADAVEAAYADLRPGRVGHAVAAAPDGIGDRRCEDGQDHVNGTLPVVAVEQEGELAALVLAYPIHGTVLGIEDLTLSKDVSGAIEQAVEDRFDHPVQVAMFNSWGADMSPGDPEVALVAGAVQPEGYDRLEAIGQVVADEVEAAVSGLSWTAEPEIEVHTHRAAIDRDLLGYPAGEFEYPWGGVYCGSGLEPDCDPNTDLYPELDDGCVPFNAEFPAPDQTEITVGRLGDLHLVTFPGEPGTLLAEGILEELQVLPGVGDVLFLGYTQDYLGYNIGEEDWWNGGYEASGTLWGPKQGEYLAAQVVQRFAVRFGDEDPVAEPPIIEPFGASTFVPYAAPAPLRLGEIATDVAASYGPTDVVQLEVFGADPWFGAPVAHLERADGTPVTRPGGQPVTSEGVAFWVDLVPDPPYSEALQVAERAFTWRFSLPVQHPVEAASPALSGDYRLRVELPDGGAGSEATSSVFTVAR